MRKYIHTTNMPMHKKHKNAQPVRSKVLNLGLKGILMNKEKQTKDKNIPIQHNT